MVIPFAGPSNTLTAARLSPLPTDLTLPPLPPIADPKVEELVFTHSSYHAKHTRPGILAEEEINDNEKLEHVGDTLLNANITLLLQELHPKLQASGATILKAHLVSNFTLSQLSRRYELPARLRAEASAVWNLRNGEGCQANLFEAYLAGLYTVYLAEAAATPGEDAVGRAFARIAQFLRPLFTPIAEWTLAELRAEQARINASTTHEGEDPQIDRLAVGAAARANEHFMKKYGNLPTYDAQRKGEATWSVVARVEGPPGTHYEAQATRQSKKAASAVAAYKICVQANLLGGV